MSSCHTEALGIIGLAEETGTEEQGRREEDSETLMGKQVFPLLIELTALLHAGPFPVPGAAGQTDKVLRDYLQHTTPAQEGIWLYKGPW